MPGIATVLCGPLVDRTVHVSLEAIEAIHLDWRGGARLPDMTIGAEQARRRDLTPRAITAFLVGLNSKISTFAVKLDQLTDENPQAMELIAELREILDKAPVVEELNGKVIRLPGYVVPLEFEDTGVSTFLLVPYFGSRTAAGQSDRVCQQQGKTESGATRPVARGTGADSRGAGAHRRPAQWP